jgi:hypothetical protein
MTAAALVWRRQLAAALLIDASIAADDGIQPKKS